jgi:TonB family protein
MKLTLVVAVAMSAAVSAQQPSYTPPRFAAGGPPALAPMAVGGGEVIVELAVDEAGRVAKVTTLRTTPPFTQLLINSVSGWRFTPATENATNPDGSPTGPRPVASNVLVAAVYRPPSLLTPTQGERPVNVAAASADVAYPSTIREPSFPANALYGAVVVIEARVDAAGAVTGARIVSSSPAFDDAAQQAARQWSFSPPRDARGGPAYVYLVFGFPQPVTGNW